MSELDHRRRPRVYGVCPGCHRVRTVRTTGGMSCHNLITDQGYTLRRPCPGVDEEPVRLADRPATPEERRMRVQVLP
jgi:hypothetical protein